ncbi:MAG TPA: prepilin-type N-terminal cleavage/methylation domain-containing protein [Acidobacteriota bacterium]|nr:prepilin-type N-terminal cleavage/methylation domain-containing protein [Acidobacteriota bacterium]
MSNRTHLRPDRRGFTLIEVLIVIAIMGILMAVAYPSITNTMAVRNLENATRQVQMTLQQTKLRAVDTKIVHRVRFFRTDTGLWAYEMEGLQVDGTWARVPGPPRKTIPGRLNATISLPLDGTDPIAIFSPVGAIVNFSVGQNTIVIQSPKLLAGGQMDERVISLFMGGAIQYAKRKSV